MEKDFKIEKQYELLRKLIHIASSSLPIFYLFTDRELNILILSILLAIALLIDSIRFFSKTFQTYFMKLFEPILRSFERDNKRLIFTGATYILFSFLMMVIFFPKPIAITAMLIVVFCDTMAALIGKNYGQNYIGTKTVEGGIAFFLTGIFVIMFTPKLTGELTEYFAAFTALSITTIVEILPTKIDDNITIPFTFAITYLLTLKIITG